MSGPRQREIIATPEPERSTLGPVDDPVEDPPTASPDHLDRLTRLSVFAAVAGLAIGVVAALVVAATRAWFPSSDLALIELHTWDTGTSLTPLVGPFSRLGWNHPGPLMFWVLAVPYRVLGSSARGLEIGVVLVNAASIAGCLWLAFKRGGTRLFLLMAIALALLVRGIGASLLMDPWNPYVPMLPLALLIMLAWSVLEGALWLLPVSAVVSCFAWQSHLGYLPVAGFLLAVALVGFVVQVRANGRAGFRGQRPDERPGGGVRSHAGRIVLVTAAVLALCLAPLAYEQFTDHPGNLTRIVDSVRAPDAPTTGLRDALSVSAMHLTPVGSWSSGIEEREPLLGTVKGANPLALLVVAAGFGVGVWAGRRNRDGPALRLLFVTGGAAAVGVVAVTRTSSELFPYLFQWMRPVAMMLWLAVAWVLVRAAAEANEAVRSALDRFLAPVAAALVVALGVASLFVAGGMHVPEAQLSDVVGELSPTVLDVAGTEPIALRTEGNTCWSGVMIGLAVQLEKNGTPVSVTEDSRASFGSQRVDRPAGRQLRVVCGPEANAAAAGAGSTPVATFGLLDAAETAESADARRILADRLQLANRPDLVAAVQSPSPAFGDLSQILTVTGDDATVGRLASILQRQAKTIAVFIEDTPTHAGTEQ